jgi:hypothetical protein
LIELLLVTQGRRGAVVLCYIDLIDRIDRIAFRESQGRWSFAT